jgi:hypothetical protein
MFVNFLENQYLINNTNTYIFEHLKLLACALKINAECRNNPLSVFPPLSQAFHQKPTTMP